MTRARKLFADPVRRFFAVNSLSRRSRRRPNRDGAVVRIEGLEDRTLLSAATTTTVTPGATHLTFGQTESLTATVSSQAGIPNAGTVTFFDSTTSLGSAPVSNGTAELSTTLSAGLHVVTATYSGDGANFAGSSTVVGPSSIIQTVAGTGTAGYNSEGIAATSAQLNRPVAVVVDSAGNLFIADALNNSVYEVSATTHIISSVAGDGIASDSSDGVPANLVQLNDPTDGGLPCSYSVEPARRECRLSRARSSARPTIFRAFLPRPSRPL
jgi:hypothetical protein